MIVKNNSIFEKVIRSDNGDKFKITVNVLTSSNDIIYRVGLKTKKFRKKSWVDVLNTDDYKYRCMSIEERQKFENDLYIKTVGKESLESALYDAWQQLKPLWK